MGKTLAGLNISGVKMRLIFQKDAPNIVTFMTGDAGFPTPETFGGLIPMPTLDRLAKKELSYNAFIF